MYKNKEIGISIACLVILILKLILSLRWESFRGYIDPILIAGFFISGYLGIK